MYSPPSLPLTLRLWMYCSVSVLFDSLIFPVVNTSDSALVQMTVVAGPPVEIQVRVNRGLVSLRAVCRVNDILPGILITPEKMEIITIHH